MNDPSTGDFDLELPSGAVESVEVLSNPFAAEYGRFSTSVTQVSTKRGTQRVALQAKQPDARLRPRLSFDQQFEPRLVWSRARSSATSCSSGSTSSTGYARTPVKSLPDEPQLGLDSFDSYTRLDAVLSSRHALTGGVIYFPRKITNATMSTFRPPETTPKFTQEGFAAGLVDRLILSERVVLETTFAARTFEVDQNTQGDLTMIYAPQTQSGNFFNRQERDVRSLQVVEAPDDIEGPVAPASTSSRLASTCSDPASTATDYSHGVDVVRLDGSLAERTTYRAGDPDPGRQRHRVGDVRSGSLARQRPAELRAGPPRRP